jgi:hypothetical protein
MALPLQTDRRTSKPGRRQADTAGDVRDAFGHENSTRRHRDCGPFGECKRLLIAASQVLIAATIFVSGAIWTAHREKPTFAQPGKLLQLPGIAVMAPGRPDSTADPARVFRVSQVLRRYTKDTARADRIATALVTEGTKKNLDPAMLIGVLLTEDAQLDPQAKSNVGAQGLMQVMPFHKGKWGCGEGSLTEIESNICYGTAILAKYIEKAPNVRTALQRYNGCVRGTNTPQCGTYSGKVLKYAEEAATQMLGVDIPDFLDPVSD